MADLELSNLLIVCAVGFAAPFALGLVPALRLPAVVLELLIGIVIGPSGLGWVHVDEPVAVLALIGLGYLLFLSGLEVEFDKLRGSLLRTAVVSFAVSIGIGIVVGLALKATNQVANPLFVAIVLSATSLGVVVPVLKDSGAIATPFGQLLISAASIADVATIILLSLFFSGEGSGIGASLVLLGLLALLAVAVTCVILFTEHSKRLSEVVTRLQDTTAQIRVRAAFLLLVGFAAAAQALGLEVILGTFIAGALISILDRDRVMTHPRFREKLEAAGFGIFIPVFFVTSGVRFDLGALTSSASTVARVPIFLACLLLVRGLPALLLYRAPAGSTRRAGIAALLQSTSLPFIIASTAVGVQLGILSAGTAAGLIAAGLLSVLLFPLIALTLLRRGEARAMVAEQGEVADPMVPRAMGELVLGGTPEEVPAPA
jgi:Kef-type K+ transport system membrane component KefB